MTENNHSHPITLENTFITKQELDEFRACLISEIDQRLDKFIDEVIEALNPEEDEEECDCAKQPEIENPARYVLFSGGQKYFASDVKPNAIVGIDFFLKEVDPESGKEYNSQGTITSSDVVIVDLKPDMDLETFSAIKQNTIDYVISKAQEAKARDDAAKKVTKPDPSNVNYMSYI